MSKYKIIFTIILIIITLVIAYNPFFIHKRPKIKTPKIHEQKKIINPSVLRKRKENKRESAKKDNLPENIEQTPDYYQTGRKERYASITESDEYFVEEYRDQKFPRNQPEPHLVSSKNKFTVWSINLNASICGKVIAYKDRLFFACYDKQIFGIEAKSGKLLLKSRLWYQPIGDPILYKDTILFPQRNGNISAHYINNLDRKWNRRLAVYQKNEKVDISISGAKLHDDFLYCSKHWGNLYILNADSGKLLSTPGVPYESRINLPADVWQDKLIFSNIAGEILCFSQNGKQFYWKREIENGYLLSMKVYQNHLYFSNTEKKFICYSLKEGNVLWKKDLPGYAFKSITFDHDKLFISAGNLYCFGLDGSLKWQVSDTGEYGFCRGPSVKMRKSIWAISQEGRLVQVDLTNGKLLFDNQMKKTSYFNPISTHEGLLFISSSQKTLSCINADSSQ